jgi:hypothetical protein
MDALARALDQELPESDVETLRAAIGLE